MREKAFENRESNENINLKLQKIADFFDDPAQAIEMLKKHFRNDSIFDDTGKRIKFDDFFKLHFAAHKRRIKSGVEHSISILQRELAGTPLSDEPERFTAGKRRPDDLDAIESRRSKTGVEDAAGFGKYTTDLEKENE